MYNNGGMALTYSLIIVLQVIIIMLVLSIFSARMEYSTINMREEVQFEQIIDGEEGVNTDTLIKLLEDITEQMKEVGPND